MPTSLAAVSPLNCVLGKDTLEECGYLAPARGSIEHLHRKSKLLQGKDQCDPVWITLLLLRLHVTSFYVPLGILPLVPHRVPLPPGIEVRQNLLK